MDKETEAPVARLWLAAVLVAALSALLIWRWSDLQVEQFSHFAELARENEIKLLPVEPPRGLIYDRNGKPLAGNRTIYSLKVESDFAGKVLGRIDALTAVVAVADDAVAKLRAAVDSPIYKGEIVLREKLREEEITEFLSWQFLFPEIVLSPDLARYYPYEDSASHVLGYVSRINAGDVERLKKTRRYDDYRGAKFIGKTGVEWFNEQRLRGVLGFQEARVDAHGRILFSHIIKPPRPGADIYLTLDWRLQQLAESLLGEERGAVVMLDVRTGELLALASAPRYNGNQFIFGISQHNWDLLNLSDNKPLIHRAIYGQYAPGSTVKPFLAFSALSNGWRDLSYRYYSRGSFQLSPKHVFHDWKAGGHGEVGIAKSIIRSVNTFYYQLGHDIGIDNVHAGLDVFGFGQKTGVDLDNEKAGVLPSERWKQEALGEDWYPGDTIAASVGQGYLQVTPLQLTRAMAMLANGGRLLQPYLNAAAAPSPAVEAFDADYLRVVRDALALVTKPGGTAPSISRDLGYGIAGKTGTAQVSRLQRDADGNRIKNEDLPKRLRDHAWFVGYAPSAEPRVAVAVIVENGGSGGRAAAPLVREMINAYMFNLIADSAGA